MSAIHLNNKLELFISNCYILAIISCTYNKCGGLLCSINLVYEAQKEGKTRQTPISNPTIVALRGNPGLCTAGSQVS